MGMSHFTCNKKDHKDGVLDEYARSEWSAQLLSRI